MVLLLYPTSVSFFDILFRHIANIIERRLHPNALAVLVTLDTFAHTDVVLIVLDSAQKCLRERQQLRSIIIKADNRNNLSSFRFFHSLHCITRGIDFAAFF